MTSDNSFITKIQALRDLMVSYYSASYILKTGLTGVEEGLVTDTRKQLDVSADAVYRLLEKLETTPEYTAAKKRRGNGTP